MVNVELSRIQKNPHYVYPRVYYIYLTDDSRVVLKVFDRKYIPVDNVSIEFERLEYDRLHDWKYWQTYTIPKELVLAFISITYELGAKEYFVVYYRRHGRPIYYESCSLEYLIREVTESDEVAYIRTAPEEVIYMDYGGLDGFAREFAEKLLIDYINRSL